MISSATTPPPTICIVRSGVIPGNATRCSGAIAARRGIQSSSCSRVMIHVSSRPDARITAPHKRASERKVLDVPTAWFGCLDCGNTLTIGARILRTSLRTSSSSSGVAIPEGRNSVVTRPAPAGTESATVGSSSEPIATSSEPPPISSTSNRPASQPYQRRAARNVRRASSLPDSTVTP